MDQQDQSTRTETPTMEEGLELLKQKNYEAALDVFDSIVEQKVQKYGELAFECAAAYYQYGKALLMQIQSQENAYNDLFANKKIEKALESHLAVNPSEAAGASDSAPSTASGKGLLSGEVDPILGNDDNESDGEGEDQEDPRELAWQNLELARIIYGNKLAHYEAKLQTSPDDEYEREFTKFMIQTIKERLANVYACLADLCVENDNFQQAVADYSKSMEIRESMTGKKDIKQFVDLHIQLAVSYLCMDRQEEAQTHYTRAAEQLTEHLNNLNKDREEYQEILNDLNERLEDFKEAERSREMLKEYTKQQLMSTIAGASGSNVGVISSGSSSSSSISKTVNIIEPKRKEKAPLQSNTISPAPTTTATATTPATGSTVDVLSVPSTKRKRDGDQQQQQQAAPASTTTTAGATEANASNEEETTSKKPREDSAKQ